MFAPLVRVGRSAALVARAARASPLEAVPSSRWTGPSSSLHRSRDFAWHQEAMLLRRATVWPEMGVATVGGRLVTETLVDPRLHASYVRLDRLRRFPVVPVPGVVACLNVGSSHKGFFHQWFEALPRAWVLNGLEQFDERPTVVVTQRLTPALSQMLAELLPAGTRVVRVPRAVRLRPVGGYLHLSVPFRSCWPEGASSPTKGLPREYLAHFGVVAERLFELDGLDQDLKLFVSRRRARARHLTNDLEVSERLGALGFTTVVLEEFSGAEQARLFRRAGVIVAQHGAALTNLLYCRTGARVIELFNGPSGGSENLYRSIAADLGLVHETVILDGPDKDTPASVPLDLLASLVS